MNDVAIIVPGIRNNTWGELYLHLMQACNGLNFEVIFVGPVDGIPTELKNQKNIKFIRDFGCPSRALQIASAFVESKYLMWMCDDVLHMYPNSITNAFNKLNNTDSTKDIINFLYTEGPAYIYGRDDRINRPEWWYKARTHDDLRLDGVDENWMIAPIFMMLTNYWNHLGGIDCRYQTINLNLHDLMFRAQAEGAELIFSDEILVHLGWQNGKENNRENTCPIYKTFFEIDLPLFKQEYNSPPKQTRIKLDNWKKSEAVWSKRWAQKHTS